MYRKVRSRLTLLFVLVTSVLLAVLLSTSFFLSAGSQLSVRISSFTNQSFTVAEDISDQNILTADWMNTRENTADFHIYLWDNGIPLFHNTNHGNIVNPTYETYLIKYLDDLTRYTDKQSESVVHPDNPETMQSTATTITGYRLRAIAGSDNIFVGYHGLFPHVLLYHRQMAKNGSILQLYFLQSLDSLYTYLWRSFLLYLLLFIASALLLGCFCWYFTGRLLAPLIASQESQNRFISAASHELRTPLAVILANASACEKAPYDQQKSFFQVISREGKQMSDMLEQLLTLSRADSYGLKLQIEKTDLQTLLLETYENFLPVASQSGHLLAIRLPEEEIPLCECDPFRIRQVCHILLHNAFSYTPSGSNITLFIESGSYDYDKEIGIGVEDNGAGIPDDEKDKIFERFYRGTQAEKQMEATSNSGSTQDENNKKGHHGLGLAVAKEIAAAHKGMLTVSSAPGGGAYFLLKLPVHFEETQSSSFKI